MTTSEQKQTHAASVPKTSVKVTTTLYKRLAASLRRDQPINAYIDGLIVDDLRYRDGAK